MVLEEARSSGRWVPAHHTVAYALERRGAVDVEKRGPGNFYVRARTIHYRVRVGKSQIHGLGLFAMGGFQPHELVGSMFLVPAKRDGTYVIWIDDAPFRVLCELRFINHSNDPNCVVTDEGQVFTTRSILHEEELTFDYGEEWQAIEDFGGAIS